MSSLLDTENEGLRVDAKPPNDQAARPPIQSFQLRRPILGIPTELLIQTFDDRILVIITQNGKVGCLYQASIPAVTPLPQPPRPTSSDSPSRLNLPPPPTSLSLQPLLGTPPPHHETLYPLYAAQIATLVWWSLQEVGQARRGVVVGLALEKGILKEDQDADDGDEGLDDKERDRFMGIMEMIATWPGPK